MINRRKLLTASSGASLLLAAGAAHGQGAGPVVETREGKLRGVSNGGVSVFKGVRYAEPPTGAHRFRRAEPLKPWTGVRDALAWGKSAPQGDPRGPAPRPGGLTLNDQPVSDDCLFLNVWTRGLNDGKKRPVMVWLHGGGFSSGSGGWPSTEGTHLAERGDVVVVTLNHRLNAFGFLYLAELGGPAFADSGNVGMLDIIDALSWVRRNIAHFGGDPGNVTIFGESGGGAKVSVLLGMPAAKGLFHRAIIQSGAHLTGLSPAEATENARLLLAEVGLGPHDVAKLQTAPVDNVLIALAKAQRRAFGPSASYSPVRDGRNLPRDPWLQAPPAISADIPIMIGSTRTETTLLLGAADPSLFDLDAAGLRTRLKPWLKNLDVETVIAAFQQATPQATPSDLFFDITTDVRVRQQSWLLAERKISQNAAPVWMYELHFDQSARMRSPHGMDVALVFDNPPGDGRPGTKEVAAAMSSAWIAFARSGNPNSPATPAWPPYSLERREVMLFEPQSRVASGWREHERAALAALPVMRVDR
jgi:para-nitrobenzyl esterase